MNMSWDRDNEDPGITVVIAKADLTTSSLSGNIDFGVTVKRDI